jgi:hypothetical protein
MRSMESNVWNTKSIFTQNEAELDNEDGDEIDNDDDDDETVEFENARDFRKGAVCNNCGKLLNANIFCSTEVKSDKVFIRCLDCFNEHEDDLIESGRDEE